MFYLFSNKKKSVLSDPILNQIGQITHYTCSMEYLKIMHELGEAGCLRFPGN